MPPGSREPEIRENENRACVCNSVSRIISGQMTTIYYLNLYDSLAPPMGPTSDHQPAFCPMTMIYDTHDVDETGWIAVCLFARVSEPSAG